jgi:hypothetical protein
MKKFLKKAKSLKAILLYNYPWWKLESIFVWQNPIVSILHYNSCFIRFSSVFMFGYITFLWSRKPAELQTLIQQQATKLLKVNSILKQFLNKQVWNSSSWYGNWSFYGDQWSFCKILGYLEIELKVKVLKRLPIKMT